ncbi:MAG: SagB/ThcOx family dehydrogenase [Desulfobacterales bacterium]|nr:SagB/ThcOx family dehydrogenase [Desulfobacterales bacterium]
MPGSDRDRVKSYHERTKHHPDRYARSLGYMDWENQPAPFRFYEGAPRIRLPLLPADPPGGPSALYAPAGAPAAFDLPQVAGFLELSLALSAWKSAAGTRWALRINPSSGNLHPTEAHLVLPGIGGCASGVYHYDPLHHALERRASLPDFLCAGFAGRGFLVGLTSIFWREAWKYGERAFRYCQHDVGHALAALRFAAGLFGWRLVVLTGLSDDEVATVLGLGRTAFPPGDEEHPELLCRVHAGPDGAPDSGLTPDIVAAFADQPFAGRPNRLSREHVGWEEIDAVARAARKPPTSASASPSPSRPLRTVDDPSGVSAARIIRQRRSAVAFDRDPGIPREGFLSILNRTLPRAGTAPFDALPAPTAAHLAVFVHAVDGLDPGLYLLVRDPADEDALRQSLRPGFAWEAVETGFPLRLLQRGNFRRTAAMLSCGQDIAGDSAFSLGMLVRFAETLAAAPHRYRELFWECGLIGQVLYLGAEVHGLRGTGIGCFFDDEVHELLGLADDRFQSLYHFTVGHPVEDRRLTTLPPY